MSDDHERLLEMMRLGIIAARNSEPALLEAILAPEFVIRVPGMPNMTRAEFIDWLRSSRGTIVSMEGESFDVRVFGDTGVVTGIRRSHMRTEAGDVIDADGFTEVFVRRDGRWQLVYSHSVPWTESPPNSPGAILEQKEENRQDAKSAKT
ncbi:nuclear transport factor 2 family protein [Pendulispora brunnea]|uniref:Nuclear transport factor 2 family protein n=1 Tax=Pendulispora brunnea TaxID=2905690 RepID=A0ABZ2KGZ2_9BACT